MGSFPASDQQLGNLARRHQELFNRVAQKVLPGPQAIRDLKHLTKQPKKGKKGKGQNGTEVPDSLDGQLAYVYNELSLIFAQVKSGQLPFRDTLISIQQLIEGNFRPEPPNPTLVHDLFTSQSDQITQLKLWNEKYGWGFKPRDFEQAARHVPDWPKDKLTAVVLVPCLPADEPPKQRPRGMTQKAYKTLKREYEGKTSLQHTLEQLWRVINSNHVTTWKSPDLRFDDEHMRMTIRTCQPGLHWAVLDLAAHDGQAPKYLDKSSLAGIEVFAAMALHPDFMAQINGDTIPFLLAAGLEAHLSIDGPFTNAYKDWNQVPGFFFYKPDQKLVVRAIDRDISFSGHSCPIVLS